MLINKWPPIRYKVALSSFIHRHVDYSIHCALRRHLNCICPLHRIKLLLRPYKMNKVALMDNRF